MADTRRRTRGTGSVFRDKNGTWHYRRELDRDPATGKPRRIEAKGKTKAEARARFDAKVAEMERTGLMPGAKSPLLKDYCERWLADYRTRVKPTTYRTRAGRCVCSIESGPCERVDVFHVSGRFWSTSACGEKRTPARPAWTSFPS